MLASDTYDVPAYFEYLQMKKKRVIYSREVFEKCTFWDPKSTIFEQNRKNCKNSSSCVRYGKFFFMLANDSQNVCDYLLHASRCKETHACYVYICMNVSIVTLCEFVNVPAMQVCVCLCIYIDVVYVRTFCNNCSLTYDEDVCAPRAKFVVS